MLLSKHKIILGLILFSFSFVLLWPYSTLIFIVLIFSLAAIYLPVQYLYTSSIVLFLVISRNEFNDLRLIANLAAVGLLIISVIRMHFEGLLKIKTPPNKVILLVLSILLTILLGVIYNYVPGNSAFALIRTIFFFVIIYLFYLIISDKSLITFILALIVSHFILSISVIYDFVKNGFQFLSPEGILARFSGFLDHPNSIGLNLIISTSFFIIAFFIKKFKKHHVLLISLLFINFIVIILSDSRAAGISIILGIGFILINLNRKLLLYTLAIGTVIVVSLLLIPSVYDMVAILLRLTEASTRSFFWDSGIEMFKDHLFFGIGAERFPYHFFTYLPSYANEMYIMSGSFDPGKIPNPHNFFLLMASENGIPGLIASFFIFILFFYYSIQNIIYNKTKNRDLHAISIALTSIGIGIFFRAFFEVSGIMSYGYILQDLPFWLLFICVLQVYNSRGKEIL